MVLPWMDAIAAEMTLNGVHLIVSHSAANPIGSSLTLVIRVKVIAKESISHSRNKTDLTQFKLKNYIILYVRTQI